MNRERIQYRDYNIRCNDLLGIECQKMAPETQLPPKLFNYRAQPCVNCNNCGSNNWRNNISKCLGRDSTSIIVHLSILADFICHMLIFCCFELICHMLNFAFFKTFKLKGTYFVSVRTPFYPFNRSIIAPNPALIIIIAGTIIDEIISRNV